MILIYAFSNRWGTNVSRLTLSELQKLISNPEINFFPINSSPQSFFEKHIKSFCALPSLSREGARRAGGLIIGLGDGPKFIDKIRIETRAKNSYNDQSIYPFSPIYLDLSLPPIDDYDHRYFDVGSNMGTYNCNYLAYSTQLYLNQKKLATYHLFLHLPPGSNASLLAESIRDFFLLNNLFSPPPCQGRG